MDSYPSHIYSYDHLFYSYPSNPGSHRGWKTSFHYQLLIFRVNKLIYQGGWSSKPYYPSNIYSYDHLFYPSKPPKISMLNPNSSSTNRAKLWSPVANTPASRSSWRRLGIGCSRCSNFTLKRCLWEREATRLKMVIFHSYVPFWIILGGTRPGELTVCYGKWPSRNSGFSH